MRESKEITELSHALISNFILKAKILSILFGVVLFFQICALIVVSTSTDLIGKAIPAKMVITGPSLLAIVFILEIVAYRYLGNKLQKGGEVKSSFIYLSTFVEVTFPCSIMLLIGNFMKSASAFSPMLIVNSPLLIILFIMIILSSLLLNSKLSLFAGAVAGIEYLIINIYFLRNEVNVSPIDFGNAVAKSALLIVSGLIAGLVSKKIRDAVASSLHSKNELIHNLDLRVAEKTAEVVAQKDEIENKNVLLEEKQKEILDSIHYARRIQTTLLPSEKYIARHVHGLKKR